MRVGALTGSVARYTRLVMLSRNLLWVLVVLVIGAVIWTATDKDESAGSRLVFSNVKVNENLENEMVNPHYQGLDSKNKPYTVIADKAIQKDKDLVLLHNIKADMQQDKGAWLALNAGGGELNITTKKLWLTDGVSMFYEGGYEMQTTKAFVDISAGTAYGDEPVTGQGPLGTLKANSFHVQGRGDVIRFNGSVILKIYR
ncbi:MAG: LPS export ABC transporter periplasmic protein LptC [Rickettsiales bacterium]|jgi:lipopolysaccharide export system protein LptC|nr:LPS export ABC transporter periplasmic protein LptC [Rickettsiales bacterium]